MGWKEYNAKRGAKRAGKNAERTTHYTRKSLDYKKQSNYERDAGDHEGASNSYARGGYYNRKANQSTRTNGDRARSGYNGAKKGYGSAKAGYNQYGGGVRSGARRLARGGSRTVGSFGRGMNNASLGTFGMITGSWGQATYKMRALVTMVLAIAVIFVPFGIFQYAGWSMYLVFTWLINSFYWFVATIVNAILNMFISSIDTIFSYVTEMVGGIYQPLESWTLTTGSLLDPDSFKPTEFDTRYLAKWLWDTFGSTLTGMFDFLKK